MSGPLNYEPRPKHIVVFTTRPGWVVDGEIMGDAALDGEDLGWMSIDDACRVADANEGKLEVVEDPDYVVKNPRREAEADSN